MLMFNNGDGHDTISYGYNSDITLKFNDTELLGISLEKFGDALVIKYNSGNDSITIAGYYNENQSNNSSMTPATYTIVDKNGVQQSLVDFISRFQIGIPEIKAWDIFATDGDDVIYLSEKNTTVYLGKGNDVVNISNSAGGNIIKTEREAQGSYSSSSNIAKLVLPDTKVTFEMSGSDLLIKSDDLSSPIVVKDYALTLDINKTALVVEDSEKAYMIHCGYTKNANGSSMNLENYNDYNHLFIYQKGEGDSGEMEYGNSNYKIYTNDKENVFNYTGGVQSSIAYSNANGLLTVNNDGLYNGREDYYIQQFSSNSGVLINAADAGYVDYLDFSNTEMKDFRIFFDVTKDEVEPNEEQTYTSHFGGVFVHTDSLSNYDALNRAVKNDWTAEHAGIVKFNGLDLSTDRIYTKNFDAWDTNNGATAIDFDAWINRIKNNVGAWLSNNNYTSVVEVLTNGTDAEKAEVMAMYNDRYDDYKYTSTGENETFTLKEGANEITFAKNFGTDTINLSADVDNYYHNDTHEDYLKFTERSFDDGTLTLERVADSDNANKMNTVIFRGLDANGDVEATVTYNKMLRDLHTYNDNYVSEDMQMTIEDVNRVYNVISKAENYYNVDLTNDALADKNNIVFTNNSKYDDYDNSVNENGFVVTSNKNHNIIYANGTARMLYNYNDGFDIVNSLSDIADDCYNIPTLTTSTSVVINDAGATDTINFHNTNADDIRFVYNYGTGSTDKTLYIVHKDALKGTDFYNLITGATTELKGVVKVTATGTTGFFGIETINTLDHMGLNYEGIKDEIQMSHLEDWFDEHSTYQNTEQVFASGNQELIASLLNCYDVEYDSLSLKDYGPYMINSTAGDDTIYFSDGMTIAKFEEISGSTKFGNDTIISTVTAANPDNTDVINITGSRLESGTITFAKNGDNLVISTRHTTNYNTDPQVWATDSTITYQNFFDEVTLHNNLMVKDAYDMYRIESYNTATTINWTAQDDNNRVAFLTASEGTNTVTTGDYNKTNIIVTDGGAALTLNYNPNGEYSNRVKVDSMSATANDIYNVNMTGSNPYLYIKDAGGNDTLNFNISTENLRVIFSVGTNIATNDIIFTDSNHLGEYSSTPRELLYKNQDWYQGGTVRVQGNIEKVTTTNYVEGIDTTAWINSIRSDVQGWLTENNYASTDAVFAQNDSTDVNELIAIYNKAYDPTMSQNP